MKPATILVPKEYVTSPFFASQPQKTGRKIIVGGKLYKIGGFSELSEDRDPCPALDIRHARVLFVLFSFITQNEIQSGNLKVKFSLHEFCKRYSNSSSSLVYRKARALLSDLSRCYISEIDENGFEERYRIINKNHIRLKPSRKKNIDLHEQEMWFDEVEFDSKFINTFSEICRLTNFNIEQFLKIRSPLGQAIYTYIPSRAIHRNNRLAAFKITLKNLLEQVGHNVPKSKSQRKQLLCQNKKSIIEQLDYSDISKGRLRIELEEASDASDYNVLFWCESDSEKTKNTKETVRGVLNQAWLGSGRSQEDYKKRIARCEPLEMHHRELLKRINIDYDKHAIFLKMAQALLGWKVFSEILSQLKADILEGNGIIKDPAAILNHRITVALQNN